MSTLPTFSLVNVSTAVTYHLRDAKILGAFALCTVNDSTGELAIHSDWGNWSYQWNPRSLGGDADRPNTLHDFLTDRSSYNYFADKLWGGGGYGGRVFDADTTVTHFQKELARERLKQGREHNRHHDVVWQKRRVYGHYEEPLTAGIARDLWDALEHLRDVSNGDLFLERYWKIDGNAWLFEEPWNELQDEVAHAYTILKDCILPVLATACAAHVARTRPATAEASPA